jgi:hypothetical protein
VDRHPRRTPRRKDRAESVSARFRAWFRTGVSFLGVAVLVAAPLLQPQGLRADGGTLRAANVVMGAYRVSVFTDPTPIPPDSIDVSVLATFERGRGVAPGLDIEIVGRRLDGSGPVIRHAATREQATDPRYYAAKFALGTEGDWEITVLVRGAEGEGEIRFSVTVQEPGLFSNPLLIIVVALLPLLLVGWWLRRTRPESVSEARP